MVGIPQRRQGALLFIKKLVRHCAYHESAEPEHPEPVANCRPVIRDMLQHMTRVNSVDASIREGEPRSLVSREVEIYSDRMGKDRHRIDVFAAVPHIDDGLARHVSGKEPVPQFFVEGAGGLTFDRPVLGHLKSSYLHARSLAVKLSRTFSGWDD